MREPSRVEQGINLLKENFKQTAYALDEQTEGKLETKNDLLLSVIIPARNEFPNIVHTIHSILNCWEADGFDYRDMEIIVVDNGSTDINYEKPADSGTVTHLMPRGIYWKRIMRVVRFPICGNHAARNKGVALARGEYVFFSDAHMSYRPGFFRNMLQTCMETKGLVHGTIAWMGGYPPLHGGLGYGYTIKLGEEIKGTWNNYLVGKGNDFFYIPAQGHCSVMARRDQFLDFGGYPEYHRTYGGGEFYLDMKWWMFGSTVAVHPKAIGYHLKSGRGYSYTHDDYIHNVFNMAYALEIDDWCERAYINWMRRGRKEVLDRMLDEARHEMIKDREFIKGRRRKTFNELILELPWDKMNIEKHGSKNSSMLVYHDSWLDLLKTAPQYVQDIYAMSEGQKRLEAFININLDQYVYKRKHDKITL